VALCPDTGERGAVRAVEKAADALRRAEVPVPAGRPLRLTFSAGVVQVEHDELAEAVAQADALLYLAKASGRDRVVGGSDRVAPPRRRILLAEDDDLFATLLEHGFDANGFELVRFRTGAELLAHAPDSHASLVLLDVRLPDVDGFEVLSTLRRHPSTGAIPILMLTAMGSEQDVVRGFELGADDYVLKPFSPVELLARVRRLLRKR
jgi:PleD family two-component response regulator